MNPREDHKGLVLERIMPGGNGELVAFDEASSTVTIRPERKGGSPHRGWFFFGLRNLIPGRHYTLKIVENVWAGVYSYSYSQEGGWEHFTRYTKDSETDFSLFITPTAPVLYVAMMPPYLQSHLDRLIAQTSGRDTLAVKDLWVSEEGRPGKVFEIGNPSGLFRIWITARMHAFEAVSSWVADGLIRWALSADPDAQWLLKNARLCVVPMVDVDSVHHGGSGKHRAPICFARDAREQPHWNAIKALLSAWKQEGAPDLFLDLHGPSGNWNDLYFYAPQPSLTTPAYERDLVGFCELLAGFLPPAMSYKKWSYRCPVGPDDQGQDMAGLSYFYLHRHYFGKSRLRLALGAETPWSDPGYTLDVFAACGAGYGSTLSRFLRLDLLA